MSENKWLDAQYSVLGSVLISPELAPKIINDTADRDYQGTCRTVFNAIRKLFLSGTPIDPVSLAAALGSGYQDFLLQLMEVTPTAANIEFYIGICREQARISLVRDIARKMTETENCDALRKFLEEANSVMVEKPALRITTMSDALKSFMDRHTKEAVYLTWPIPVLNDWIYAEPGDMIVLGGYPSTGKSAWALQCAWHWARNSKVGFFSLETSSEKLFDRQMAAVAHLSMDAIKRNDIPKAEWNRICSMCGDITARNLEFVPASGMSVADVKAVTMMRGYQIIVVDYLQLLQGAGENRTAQVTSISIALHTMAQSMGVTVVALSQLARQSRQDGQMGMSLLRESGQIEQDADVIMMLRMDDKDESGVNRILKTVKNKEGMCPELKVAFDGKHQTFSQAQRTGDTVGKYASQGKKIKRQNHLAVQQTGQMSMLPDSTPVPFQK